MFGRRKKRSFFFFSREDDDVGFDPSTFLSKSAYCRIVRKFPKICLEINLPQIWSNDENHLESLTLEKVTDDLNSTKLSPVNGHPIAFTELLGGVTRDENGKIIGAKSLLSVWMTHFNFSAVDMDATGNNAGTSDWATLEVLDWESGFLDLLEKESKENNLTFFYEAGRSFGDVSGSSMFQDIGKLAVGTILMFFFIQLVLPGRYNLVEMRMWLGSVGLLCILLSYIIAVGLCSLLGIRYGPVHASLPFLMLGIGVDDMFVIMACWQNLAPAQRTLPIDERIAITLKHAGMSITITSFTDAIAFLIGSFTILPCLQSFCLYTAMGICVMYVFQATIFIAVLSLDAKRIRRGGNCLLSCIKHKNFHEQEITESRQSKYCGSVYDKILLTTPARIIVIITTVIFAGFGINGSLQLTQRFEPEWFLPDHSYIMKYISHRRMYYPDMGMDGSVFIGKANYSEEFVKIHNLSLAVEAEDKILKSVDSWTHGFIKYAKHSEQKDVLVEILSEDDFMRILSNYLWSRSGARFQKNFQFSSELICGEPAPPIEISSMNFIFRRFKGPEEYIPAMNKLKKIAKDAQLPRSSVWAKIFGNWVTDEVIDHELLRNLGMALTCVMICTGILIIDLQMCFWIFMSVVLTLVNVAGFMYYWGLHIDVGSCIALVLAVGLCVDFAAHIGHTFLRSTGSRRERSLKTVQHIGTATLNGATSTLLALSLLGVSDAYIFQVFFKIFLLVILFGVFHGVVFMPVVLSFIGPPSYNDDIQKQPPAREMTVFHSSEATNEEIKALTKGETIVA